MPLGDDCDGAVGHFDGGLVVDGVRGARDVGAVRALPGEKTATRRRTGPPEPSSIPAVRRALRAIRRAPRRVRIEYPVYVRMPHRSLV